MNNDYEQLTNIKTKETANDKQMTGTEHCVLLHLPLGLSASYFNCQIS